MFCHVVLFFVVLICKQPFGADEIKPSLADQLNATLSSPGWMRIINVVAKLPFTVNGHHYFTGKNLFVSHNLFFDNENSVNTLVDDDNANVKHYMVTHLVGCVYVNAMVTFIDLLRIIFEEIKRARKHQKDEAYYQKMKKLDDAKRMAKYAKEAAEEAVPVQIEITDEEFIDYKIPWEIFNIALLQFADSSTMFDLMYSTMRYLIDTIPTDEPFGYDLHIRELLDIQVVPCLQLFKDGSRNINLVLPDYVGKHDPHYNDKVGPLSFQFTWFLNDQADLTLRPFLEKFCTVLETASPTLKTEIRLFDNMHKRKPTSFEIANKVGEDISKLAHKVCNNYYSQLGFLYDNREQTTSYAIPPTL